MIGLANIHFTYHRSQINEYKLITNLSLSIHEAEFVILLGANGSGKTTLMNLISGSSMVDDGSIHILENDITHLSEHKRCKWISRIFQNPLLGTAPDLTILENFRLAAMRTKNKGLVIGTGKNFRDKVQDHLKNLELGLENKLDHQVGSLSGGQRQALTLSMAVMDESKILLMDEPTAALDPKTSEVFMNLAEKIILERKLTTILITHHLKDALKYGDRILHLQHGHLARDIQGDKKNTLTHNELFSWFTD